MSDQWGVLWQLGLALLLSSVIGAERELRQKSAGLRTHALVGVGAALFTLVGAYGFGATLQPGQPALDPTRVAAQVVSGIGFIGGGMIFVHRDAVRGLTTAAGVWLVAAIGMAAAAGLPVLAIAATAGYFVIVLAYPALTKLLPSPRHPSSWVRLSYLDSRGVLRDALALCTRAGFAVADLAVQRGDQDGGPHTVAVRLQLHGTGSLATLVTELGELDGVVSVSAEDANEALD